MSIYAADIAHDAYLAAGPEVTIRNDHYGNSVLTSGDARFVIGDEFDHDAVAGTDDDAPLWGYSWTTYAAEHSGDEESEAIISQDGSPDPQAARDAITNWLRSLG